MRDRLIIACRNLTAGIAADSPTVSDQYMPYYDIYDPNIRCGRGAATSGPGTKTATVVAGSEVGFVIGRSADEVCVTLMALATRSGQSRIGKC
jgi:hypothetical protein